MPIDIEEFENEPSVGTTNAERILGFLAANDDKAFTRSEIADAVGLDSDVASAVLNRLKNRKLVRHRRPYWAIGDPRRVRAAVDLNLSVDALDDRLGPEDMDEWRAAADDSSDSEDDR